jgi:hypothetical protein
LTDKLHGKLFLSHIIIALDYYPNQPPSFKMTKRRVLSDSFLLFKRCFKKDVISGSIFEESL